MLIQKTIVFSCRAFGHSLAGMRKIRALRAHKIVKTFIEKDAMGQTFFTKSKAWLDKMRALQVRMRRQIKRRQYKKMILREYWKAVLERCQKLKLRNQTSALKKIQGLNLD